MAGGTFTVAASIAAFPGRLRAGKPPFPREVAGAVSPALTSEVGTVVDFLGALFGRTLTLLDRQELNDRLSFAATVEEDLGKQFSVLAAYLDSCAGAAGASSFRLGRPEQRFTIIDDLMNIDTAALASRILWRISPSERALRRMRDVTIPRLALLYRSSGVPWRARGYVRWPGMPGAWDEYTRAGAPYPRG